MLAGEDVREVLEAILPSAQLEQWAKDLGVVERSRKLELAALVRATVLTAGTPGGGFQADILRAYLENDGIQAVHRSAFYKWLDEEYEQLMEMVANNALAYANRLEPDLPHPLDIVSDWWIVDSSTVRLDDAAKNEFPGTGDYAAIKVHKRLSVGTGVTIHYTFSPAREHDSKHLEINESWRGKGLLADLGYASIERLRDCQTHGTLFVIRLKENWKPRVKKIHRGEIAGTIFEGADFNTLIKDEVILLNGRAIDVCVEVGPRDNPIELRLVGVKTKRGYCFYLTNLPARIGPWQVAEIYRVRWEVELSIKVDKSDHRLEENNAQRKCVIKALLHASLIASIITAILVHKHNSQTRPAPGETERTTAPLHPQLLAKVLASQATRISDAFELKGQAAKEAWDQIAKRLVHGSRDPNWRSRPSVLDRLRGWHRKPREYKNSA